MLITVFVISPLAVDCGPLTPPTNGDVLVFNTTLAHPATYSCNVGFKISGQKFRVCTINGSWSGREPTCKGDVPPSIHPSIVNQ